MQVNFERVIAFDGIHNFRDYGGYAVSGGGRVVAGKLYRSAQHFDATPDDLHRVGALGLGTVIDLRGGRERANAPCPRPLNFWATIISTDQETASLAPHLEAGKTADTAAAMHQRMIDVYKTIAFRAELNRVFARYFVALAESDRPSLIHCLAGKDRTGIAVALFHNVVGVHPDDMMADYMLTNTAGNTEARIAAGTRGLRHGMGKSLSDEALRVIMSVHPDYLATAFAAMTDRYGSASGYMRDVLGVDEAQRAAIKQRFVI